MMLPDLIQAFCDTGRRIIPKEEKLAFLRGKMSLDRLKSEHSDLDLRRDPFNVDGVTKVNRGRNVILEKKKDENPKRVQRYYYFHESNGDRLCKPLSQCWIEVRRDFKHAEEDKITAKISLNHKKVYHLLDQETSNWTKLRVDDGFSEYLDTYGALLTDRQKRLLLRHL